MEPVVKYLPDSSVDAALDAEIRGLLTTCFTKPQDVVFRDRRYFKEPYPNRWVVRNETGVMVAHVGVHEKAVEAQGRRFPITGICEVCVHPDYRGRGFVRTMMIAVHNWAAGREFVFSVLFGNPLVYASSGYVQMDNFAYDGTTPEGLKIRQSASAMVRLLTGTPWPKSEVYLPGPNF